MLFKYFARNLWKKIIYYVNKIIYGLFDYHLQIKGIGYSNTNTSNIQKGPRRKSNDFYESVSHDCNVYTFQTSVIVFGPKGAYVLELIYYILVILYF